ncbi:MAG: SDR family NAD(P)-dependent oxidoreductase [Parvularculaceae bacterium]|nr:SDR family NAD(P)-dependent oxidoreductase [Parvularculaceae bacterium]
MKGERRQRLRVLVTGGGSGIGAAVVRRAAAGGHSVFAGGRRFDALRETVHKVDGGVWTLPLNVRDESSCQAAIAAMVNALSGVDVLICSAGVASAGAFEETPIDEFKRVMDVNFLGVVRMAKAALPAMREAGSGVIIAVSSLSGLIGLPGDSPYAASKFALEGAFESLAPEIARFGVKVFLAEPGGVATEFMQDAVPSRAGESDVYRTFNDFLKNAGRGSGGADADVIAAEIVDLMENPIGPLRRPLGDQARSVASKLDMMSDEARAQFALNAAGLAWWANGDEPPRG